MIYRFLVLLLFVLLPSCGGGSAGTGGQRYEGNLETRSMAKIAGATVTLGATGESTQTDLNGNFVFLTDLAEPQVELFVDGEFEGSAFSSAVLLSGLPPSKDIVVTVQLELDQTSSTVNLKELSTRPKETKDDSKDTDNGSSSSVSSVRSSSSSSAGNSSSIQSSEESSSAQSSEGSSSSVTSSASSSSSSGSSSSRQKPGDVPVDPIAEP